MRLHILALGLLLVIIGILLTYVFGTLYGWPLLLIGIPLILLGLVIPKSGSSWLKKKIHTCPTCGADLPDDATMCPACGKLH